MGDQFVYLAGGLDESQSPKMNFGDLWAFDRADGSWTPLQDLPNPRYDVGIAWLAGTLYVFGGTYATAVANQYQYYGDLLAYSPSPPPLGSWATVTQPPDGPGAGAGRTLSAVGGKLYVYGGWPASQVGVFDPNLYCFDPATNTWGDSGASNPPPARASHTAVPYRGGLLVFGGSIRQGLLTVPASDLWYYRP
jgi:N-acetylneuraminic acid mutarotase